MYDIKSERALYLFLCGINASSEQLCGKQALEPCQRKRLTAVSAEELFENYRAFSEKAEKSGYKPDGECERLAFSAIRNAGETFIKKYAEIKRKRELK